MRQEEERREREELLENVSEETEGHAVRKDKNQGKSESAWASETEQLV